jgi:predicted GNAT family acetyltransferase
MSKGMYELNRFSGVSQYYERVKDYLLQHEAHHSVILGLIDALINSPDRFQHPPYLATVEADETVLAVALQLPPRKLLLSQAIALRAIEMFAQDFHSRLESLTGLMGPALEVKTFAQTWQALTGQSYRQGMVQRCFQLETVQPLAKVNGHLRVGTSAERELLKTWCQAFIKEALNEVEKQDAESIAARLLRQGGLYLWQDQIPVSMANSTGPTPNGIRINLVYTPPEYRRKGYATACVAALSRSLLEQGRKYCFLFTDLANPTSNHIYQKIGYQPVGDLLDYWFED